MLFPASVGEAAILVASVAGAVDAAVRDPLRPLPASHRQMLCVDAVRLATS